MMVSKVVPRPSGVLRPVYVSNILTNIGPCKLPKTLEMDNYRTDGVYTGVLGGLQGGGVSLEQAKRARKVFEGGLYGEGGLRGERVLARVLEGASAQYGQS